MALHTLANIRSMVRDLTHSQSVNQLTDAEIDDRVNTYMTKDMPLSLRNFNLSTTLEWYTQPYVGEYTSSTESNTPLYDFKNRYLNVYGPVLFNGQGGSFTQDFIGFTTQWTLYAPQIDTLLRGNGGPGPYVTNITNFFSVPVLQNNVTFSAIDANGKALILKDYPIDNMTGNLAIPGTAGQLPGPAPAPFPILGTINYVTGALSITFPGNVPLNQTIYAHLTPYIPSRPYAMLYYGGKFTVRPVPNDVYRVVMQADIKPSELLNARSVPDEENWWELVAMGAALKIFIRRTDTDSIARLQPIYEEELLKVTRKLELQWTSQRTKTFWTEQNNTKLFQWPPYRPY